jgi:hypothetical protein
MNKEKELRCFCSREPLLATYGVDHSGTLFVHVKIWKQRRIYGELVVEGGLVKLRCRECLRWHEVRIVQRRAVLHETSQEEPVSVI